MLQQLIELPRSGKKLFLVAMDILILYSALWLAFFIRLEEVWPRVLQSHWQGILLAPLLAIPVFISLGLYRAVIRYIAPRFVLTITKAALVAGCALVATCVMGAIEGVPRSVYFLYIITTGVLIGGTRLIARETLALPLLGDRGKKLVAIYGAGAAGTQICKALMSSPQYQPLVFLDDNRELHNLEVLACKVYAPNDLSSLISKYQLEEVILSVPSESLCRRREILEFLHKFPVLVKTVPGIPDLVSGEIQVNDLRKVEIEDLLGREPVAPNESLLRANISGKHVMVTGAGGSIGSELCNQIATQSPACLILFERNEYALYCQDRHLREVFPELTIVAILGSITDRQRLDRVMATHRVETIYHAAAYKHVPLVEANLIEGVKNNIFGTLALAQAAVAHGAETFILISTDKAVRPTNVMGATKRFAELILQGLSHPDCLTRFTMVRFGNVLGSSGSVVPLFRTQIESGGPVTVTHPEMTRYFMTIPEAAQLVIQAGSMGQGGDVFVLDMGESVKIMDLAQRMIHLSGLSVIDPVRGSGDIAISFTGLRPGEKLFEELLIGNNVFPTEHSRIKRAEETCMSWDDVDSFLNQLKDAVMRFDSVRVRDVFEAADIGYTANSRIADAATPTNHALSSISP